MTDCRLMSDYRPPTWRDALRVYLRALWMIVEPAFVAVVMLALGVPWWAYIVLLLIWLPLARIRLRQVRNDWVG